MYDPFGPQPPPGTVQTMGAPNGLPPNALSGFHNPGWRNGPVDTQRQDWRTAKQDWRAARPDHTQGMPQADWQTQMQGWRDDRPQRPDWGSQGFGGGITPGGFPATQFNPPTGQQGGWMQNLPPGFDINAFMAAHQGGGQQGWRGGQDWRSMIPMPPVTGG